MMVMAEFTHISTLALKSPTELKHALPKGAATRQSPLKALRQPQALQAPLPPQELQQLQMPCSSLNRPGFPTPPNRTFGHIEGLVLWRLGATAQRLKNSGGFQRNLDDVHGNPQIFLQA